jgi:hypothetical protein
LGGLWEALGRGAKPKWQASDLEYLTDCLEHEPRTYNSLQLAKKLKQERLVDLSSDRLCRLIKKNCNYSGLKDKDDFCPCAKRCLKCSQSKINPE